MTRGLYFDNPEDADDIRKCIVNYIFETVDYGSIAEGVSDYIINNDVSGIAFKLENEDIDSIIENLRDIAEIDIPDVKDVNELYDFIEANYPENIEDYNEIIMEYEMDLADGIVDSYDSWGNYYLPYDMADYILGTNGAAKIYAQCEKDDDFSEEHIADIFMKQFVAGKDLDDIGVQVCIDVEIPRIMKNH